VGNIRNASDEQTCLSQLIQEEDSELIDHMQGMFIMKMMNHLAKLLYEDFPAKEDQLLMDEEQ
jgi:hypothetical protein